MYMYMYMYIYNGIKWIVPTTATKYSLVGINFMEYKNHPSYIALDSLKEENRQTQEQKQEHEDQELNQQLKEDQKEHVKYFINKM